MLKRRHEVGLAFEPLGELAVDGDRRFERFDGDPPIERFLDRLIDDSHTPAADFTENATRSDSLNHRDPSH